MALNKSSPYENYAAFKAAMGDLSIPRAPAYSKSLVETLSLPEGTLISDLSPANMVHPSEILAAFESVMNELPNAPQAAKRGRDYTSIDNLMSLLDKTIAGGKLSFQEVSSIQKYLTMLGEAEVGHFGLRQRFNSIIGYYGEALVKNQLTEDGPLIRSLADQAITSIPLPQHSGQRASLSFSGNFGAPFSYAINAGSHITDLAVKLNSKDGRATGQFNLSVKTSGTSRGTNIKAFSGQFGRLMSKVFTNDYFGYGFYRLIGRLPLGEIPDVARYVLTRNFYEALQGSGADKISDFVINSRIYSAKHFIEAVRREVRSSRKNYLSIIGAVQEPMSSADQAITNWIESRHINSINAAKFSIDFSLN